MKTNQLMATMVALALLGGCSATSQNAKPAATSASTIGTLPENTLATVNGKPIVKADVQALISEIEQKRGPQKIPEDRIVDDLISRELLRQEAEKQNLTQNPAIASRLESSARMLLAQAAAENFMKNSGVSDEDVRKEYDTRVSAEKLIELKARHILVESEEEAKNVLGKLNKGSKFEALAKKFSKDPGSKNNGGELGWFNSHQMLPEFSNAVAALKNGEITPQPVHTQFGWHIIQREDEREQAPPPFDDVKAQIRSFLGGQKLRQHIEELKTAAKIERKDSAPKAETDAKP